MTPPLDGEIQGSGPYGSTQGDPDESTSLQALLDRWGSLPLGASLVLFDDLLSDVEGGAGAAGTRAELTPRSVTVNDSGRFSRRDTTWSSPYRGSPASPASTAPELRGGAARSAAADVYAVSALFLESATGVPAQVAAGAGAGLNVAGLDSPLPEAVLGVARQGLAADPGERPSPGLLRARLGIAGDVALHEWRTRGRTWLSSAVSTLRPKPDAVPPTIDWSAYGPRPGAEPEATGFLGLAPRPRVLTGLGIAFTGLLMTIIGTCNIGTAPPQQTGVSAATQPAAVATPTPAATTNPGFVVPSQATTPDAGQAAVSPSPAPAAAPTAEPTVLPTVDPNVFTPLPEPTDVPTPPPPTPAPTSCLLFC